MFFNTERIQRAGERKQERIKLKKQPEPNLI